MTKRAQLKMVLAVIMTALLAALALGVTARVGQGDAKGDTRGAGSAQFFAPSSEQYTDPSGSQPETVEALVESAASDVNIFWEGFFEANGAPYSSPYLAYIYDEPVETGCGISDTSQGPGYCRLDQTFYFPVGWTDSSTGGSYLEEYGDFAVAVIVAHEMAHHVQQQMDILDIQDVGDLLTIESELQADCFAGAWANHAETVPDESGQPLIAEITSDDMDRALDAAGRIGDDFIQENLGSGQVDQDAFTHGSSEQRRRWFTIGYETGDPAQCDTFATDDLG